MKITFLGNFNVDYTSESHYLKTFLAMGYEVATFQESVAKIEDILKEAITSDIFFWVHTHGWETPGISEALELLKEKGIPSVGYHLDLWLGISREKDLETDPYWGIEHFFSVDQLMVDLLNSNPKLPKGHFLPAGVFAEECYLGEEQTQYKHDIIFVGSKQYHKEWPYRTELIKWLEDTYGKKFALYGRDGYGVVRGQDLNDLYASAKIVIGDTLCKNFDYPYYLSDRIFETTGRGGFIIHPYIKGLEDLFELPKPLTLAGDMFKTSDTELITYPFGNFEYLKYLIDYFLKNEDERKEIQLRGHKRTKSEHTYTHRLHQMLKTIEKEVKK